MNLPMSAKSTIASNLRLVSASLIPRMAPFRKRFSRPVSCGWKPAPVAIRPAIRPRVRMLPSSGRITPLISLSRVLLPEPLSPISPTDSPCSTVNETSSTARNFSCSGSRRAVATAICFRVRWYCIVNCFETCSTSIETVIGYSLSGNLFSRREKNFCANHRNTRHTASVMKPRVYMSGGNWVPEPAGVLDQRVPEQPLQQQHRLGDRVGVVDLVEHRVGVVRRVDQRERVEHRHQEVHELHDRADDVLEVAEEHVERGEQQRHRHRERDQDAHAEHAGPDRCPGEVPAR